MIMTQTLEYMSLKQNCSLIYNADITQERVISISNQSEIFSKQKKPYITIKLKLGFDHIEIITRKSKEKISINQIKYLQNLKKLI